MEDVRALSKEELVDAVMSAALALNLTVEKIQIEDPDMRIHIGYLLVTVPLTELWEMTIKEITEYLGKQLNVE